MVTRSETDLFSINLQSSLNRKDIAKETKFNLSVLCRQLDQTLRKVFRGDMYTKFQQETIKAAARDVTRTAELEYLHQGEQNPIVLVAAMKGIQQALVTLKKECEGRDTLAWLNE